MTSNIVPSTRSIVQLERNAWVRLGLIAAAASIMMVLVVQWLAIAIWPEIALFAPLDNYLRSVVFTLVPVSIATALFAWLVEHRPRPVRTFMTISVAVLLISIIPDYAISVPNKTLLASSVTAFLHVVAAVTTVALLVTNYQRHVDRARHKQGAL